IVLNNKDTSFILAGNTVHTNNGDVKIINKRFALYTLATPRGGEYSLILPDGTKVWLNADSRLVYPSFFTGNTRNVQLEGEAYFDVKRDAGRPFIVRLPSSRLEEGERSEIKVLGTEFNVQAYKDEPNITTTLVKGKVQINNMVSK